jgi:hypothetical protein
MRPRAFLLGSVLALAAASGLAQTVGPVAVPAPQQTAPAPAPAPAPPPPSPELLAARAAIEAGRAAVAEGRVADAAARFRAALLAPPGADGDLVAAEAARRLGFLAIEAQNPRDAEKFYRAEALLSRRLFVEGRLSANRFAESLNRLASALGIQGRSQESAQMIGYGVELRDRARAAESMAALRRPVEEQAVEIGFRLPPAPATCLVASDPALAARMTCAEDQALRNEALLSDSRRIKANAPPPETAQEKQARQAREKAEARRKR